MSITIYGLMLTNSTIFVKLIINNSLTISNNILVIGIIGLDIRIELNVRLKYMNRFLPQAMHYNMSVSKFHFFYQFEKSDI